MRFIGYSIILLLYVQFAFAQQDIPAVRRVPALGIQITDKEEQDLNVGLREFAKTIDQLKLKGDHFTRDLLPDVLIYYKAVDYAVKYHEFFNAKEVGSAEHLLEEGQFRGKALLAGRAPWTTQKGEVVRGYISKIDGSVQPYGLSIPESYSPSGNKSNLSLWFHGRGENLSELNFISNGKGFLPAMPEMKNTIMLYPYGRYCNGFKFAGEVDVLEAMEAVKKHYAINENAVFNRGFSMGGAAVWQFAVHYPDWWLAANPGAGFAETTEFLLLDKEVLHPNWYGKKLLHLYDCTDYASNLSNLPIVAYNGELDLQKQAADMMEKAMHEEGLPLKRVVGPNTKHAYHPVSAKIVDSLLEIEAVKGKRPVPKKLHFTTYTLKYNKMYWLRVDGLKEHWERTRVDGNINGQSLSLKTVNVSALSLDPVELPAIISLGKPVVVTIDGSSFKIAKTTKQSVLNFHVENGKWLLGAQKTLMVKKHDLQGPVDDAFMSAFIVVKPTGKSSNQLFDDWSKSELERFLVQWRRQFRGDAIVKNDVDITDNDLSSNLIVFGDSESNHVLARIRNKLPIQWDATNIHAGDMTYSSKDHALIMIYPNPLNSGKYVVLNSGFTFREESFLNNAKQIPMLPDWAVIDLNTPAGPVYPGKVSRAGFFGENWQWKDAIAGKTSYRFSFGKAVQGSVPVKSSAIYTDEKGFGFDFGTTPGAAPFYFSAKVPEGNYKVTVKLGDQKRPAQATVKAESRRLMLENVRTAAGEFVTKTFIVNIKDRNFKDGAQVGLKPRELTKLDWDNKLTLEFDLNAGIQSIDISKVEDQVTVFLAGNSTVVDQDDEPWASWGQMIPRFFKPGVAISNHAESGLSLGSFISSKRLEKVLSVMKAGDYVFVEFGHNDEKEKGPADGPYKSYTERLHLFAREVKSKGGHLIILTPSARRTFNAEGKMENSHGDYPDAARKVAQEEGVPLIDLTALTTKFYEALGPEGSKKAFVIYPELNLNDNTHFNPYGAYEIARMVVQGIKDLRLDLAGKLIATPVFDPAKPDQFDLFVWPPSPKASVVKPDGN